MLRKVLETEIIVATIELLTSTINARSIRLSRLLTAKSLPEPTFTEDNYSKYSGEDIKLRNIRLELARAV